MANTKKGAKVANPEAQKEAAKPATGKKQVKVSKKPAQKSVSVDTKLKGVDTNSDPKEYTVTIKKRKSFKKFLKGVWCKISNAFKKAWACVSSPFRKNKNA